VLVDGEVVATRGGSMLARFFGGGWPQAGAVVEAIRSRQGAAVKAN
jgi:hypothetical protein